MHGEAGSLAPRMEWGFEVIDGCHGHWSHLMAYMASKAWLQRWKPRSPETRRYAITSPSEASICVLGVET